MNSLSIEAEMLTGKLKRDVTELHDVFTLSPKVW